MCISSLWILGVITYVIYTQFMHNLSIHNLRNFMNSIYFKEFLKELLLDTGSISIYIQQIIQYFNSYLIF